MLRLGLQLTLRSGREALVRLVITAAAVAAGVALLLGVLAEFHAFQANASQACWSCTTGAPIPSPLPSHGELWNDSVDFYQGQTITRLDVAPLGPGAPVPPGITRLPAPGEYYASPALAALLKTVPADELGDRFPGQLAGTIGDTALNGANDLVIYIGYTPAALAALPNLPTSSKGGPVPGTQWVTSISAAPPPEVFTPFFRYAFGVGVLAVLFPMLVLISTATRLAADRREERFAALRLVGGTPADIRVIASVESVVSAFFGAVLGVAIFLLVRPALAGAALIGTRYFESELTPTLWGYLAMLAGVPAAAAVAALISLRRVQVSPLGVSRRATPKPPTFWRLVPLVLGLALYVYGLSKTTRQSIGAPAYPGLLLTMIGLVIAGPWLTAGASRLFGRLIPGSSALLATRRLADNPKRAFRAVTGLVLAVFLGTMVGTLVPAVNSTEASPANGALSNMLLGQVGTRPAAGGEADQRAQRDPRRHRIPAVFTAGWGRQRRARPRTWRHSGQLRGHARARALGQCAPGLRAVQASDDSACSTTTRCTTPSRSSSAANPGLPGQAVQPAAADGPGQGEQPRDAGAGPHLPGRQHAAAAGRRQGSAPTPPRTFGETLQIRTARAATFEKIMYAAVALTLIVAGCSLAVTVGGGLVDRKRPFTLLRVSGTPVGVLSRVVLLEAAVPLVAATMVAAGIAYGTSVMAFSGSRRPAPRSRSSGRTTTRSWASAWSSPSASSR